MLLLDCVDEKSVDGGEDSGLSHCLVLCCRTNVGRIPGPIEATDKLLLESIGIPVNAPPSIADVCNRDEEESKVDAVDEVGVHED